MGVSIAVDAGVRRRSSGVSVRRLIGIALIVAFLAVLIGPMWGALRPTPMIDTPGGVLTAAVPGETAIAVSAPGEVKVVDRASSGVASVELGVTVAGPSGALVPIHTSGEELGIETSGRRGRRQTIGTLIASFRANRAGTYVLRVNPVTLAAPKLNVEGTRDHDVLVGVGNALLLGVALLIAACGFALWRSALAARR